MSSINANSESEMAGGPYLHRDGEYVAKDIRMWNMLDFNGLLFRRPRRVFFVLCNSCFWCASDIGDLGIEKCPTCNNHAIEYMPISQGERFSFDYDKKRGVSLGFRRS
jgi:hypothetical protein